MVQFQSFLLLLLLLLLSSSTCYALQFASRVLSSSATDSTANTAAEALGAPNILEYTNQRAANGWVPTSRSASAFLELGFSQRVCVQKVILWAARNVDCVHRLSVGGVDVFDKRTSTFGFCAVRTKLQVLDYEVKPPRMADSVRFEFDFVRQLVEIDAAAIIGYANDPACGGSGMPAPFPTLPFAATPPPTVVVDNSTKLWSTFPLATYHVVGGGTYDDVDFNSDFACSRPGEACTRPNEYATNMIYFSPLQSGQQLFGVDWCQSAVGGGAFGGALFVRVKVGESTKLVGPQFVALCPHVSRDVYLADPFKFDNLALVSLVVEPQFPPALNSTRDVKQMIVCTAVLHVNGTCGLGEPRFLALTGICGCDCPAERGGARCERCNDALFCSGSGTCQFDSEMKPKCKCADSYFGATCATRCASCNGHGACNNEGMCECTGGFAPPDCKCMSGDMACMESQLAPCRAADGAVCSNRGRCENAACSCDAGFRGSKCERQARRAPSACTAAVLDAANEEQLAGARPVVPSCVLKSSVVASAMAIRETSDGNILVISRDAAYILDPSDLSLKQAIEFEFRDRVNVATLAVSMIANYPFNPYASFTTRFDNTNFGDELIGFMWPVLAEAACNEKSQRLTLYATRYRLDTSTSSLPSDYVVLRSYQFGGSAGGNGSRTAVERLSLTVRNITRTIDSTASTWELFGVQVFTSGTLADTALAVFGGQVETAMVVARLSLATGQLLQATTFSHANYSYFRARDGIAALETANGTWMFVLLAQSFDRSMIVVIDENLTLAATHVLPGEHSAYVEVDDRWKMMAVSGNGSLLIFDIESGKIDRQVQLSASPILSVENRRDTVAFALRGNDLLFVACNSTSTLTHLRLHSINLVTSVAAPPVLLSKDGASLSVKMRGGSGGAPLQVVQRRVRVSDDDDPLIADDLVLIELDEARQSVASTETIENIRRVLNEHVAPNGVLFTPNASEELVLANDCTVLNGSGDVDYEVVVSFVMLGLAVLGTLVECSAMYGKFPWRGSKKLVSCVTIVIIAAEVVMLVLSSIALNNALAAIDAQLQTALTLEQMNQRFTQRLRLPQCQVLGASEFCSSCGVNDAARSTFVDAKRLKGWVDAGNQSHQFFPGGFDNRDCGNGTALCQQARPTSCDLLLHDTCDCERSFFLAPCTCAGGDTCGTIGAVSNSSTFRPEITAALEQCKGEYSYIASLLSALLYVDITFTFIELVFDIALRMCWCCAGGAQTMSEWLARILSVLFFAVFGIMLLVTNAAAPVNLICNRDNVLLGALPGCEFTPAWSESNAEREIVALVAVAIAIAIPNTIIFVVDAIRFWLGVCSDTFAIDDADDLPLKKLTGR